jgi:Bacteriophage tail sheath protein
MPTTPTYPGVYIEEIPSGVRTITGVATSIAAFVGYTARGPLNKAVRVLSFADFERNFGGLTRDSEVSYAVHHAFDHRAIRAVRDVQVLGPPLELGWFGHNSPPKPQ